MSGAEDTASTSTDIPFLTCRDGFAQSRPHHSVVPITCNYQPQCEPGLPDGAAHVSQAFEARRPDQKQDVPAALMAHSVAMERPTSRYDHRNDVRPRSTVLPLLSGADLAVDTAYPDDLTDADPPADEAYQSTLASRGCLSHHLPHRPREGDHVSASGGTVRCDSGSPVSNTGWRVYTEVRSRSPPLCTEQRITKGGPVGRSRSARRVVKNDQRDPTTRLAAKKSLSEDASVKSPASAVRTSFNVPPSTTTKLSEPAKDVQGVVCPTPREYQSRRTLSPTCSKPSPGMRQREASGISHNVVNEHSWSQCTPVKFPVGLPVQAEQQSQSTSPILPNLSNQASSRLGPAAFQADQDQYIRQRAPRNTDELQRRNTYVPAPACPSLNISQKPTLTLILPPRTSLGRRRRESHRGIRSCTTDQGVSGQAPATPSYDSASSSSPASSVRSAFRSEDEDNAYETPSTSPESSPGDLQSGVARPLWTRYIPCQLDGEDNHGAHVISHTEASFDTIERRKASVDEGSRPNATSEAREDVRDAHHSGCTASDPRSPHVQDASPHTTLLSADNPTPEAPACLTGAATAFPCPGTRHPSALLRHYERKASPRQRRAMSGVLYSPDRFIAGRTNASTRDTMILRKPHSDMSPQQKRLFRLESTLDPFGAAADRSARMAAQFATLRGPEPSPRSAGAVLTPVNHASVHRTTSEGGLWSVGGVMVTEGVSSMTDGRGGRITRGTSATHHTADFLSRATSGEEEANHGSRLAVAMNLDQSARVIEHRTSQQAPYSAAPHPHSGRVWRDNAWQYDRPSKPAKMPIKRAKDVPVIPFRVLDAPALRDDYYCSLLAFSATINCLAVGLGPHVYLWSEHRDPSLNLPDSLTARHGAHVTSLSFSCMAGACAILAIGRANGRITLWSPLDSDPRFDSEQPAPVSCVSFRPNTVRRSSVRAPGTLVSTEELIVGDEMGCVYFYSVEWPTQDERDLFDWHGSMTLLARVSCHNQQVCGIAWSPDGQYFASGGNDNHLLLYETKKVLIAPSSHAPGDGSTTVNVRRGGSGTDDAAVTGQGNVLSIKPGQERHAFTLNAAVKAIAFAPWQSSLVAASGGSNDRCIHFFHTLSGATLATIDCHAQVTSLVWSERRREIAATFGFAQPEHPYRVAVFTWPGCVMVVGIPWWSEERALYAVAYPRGPMGGQDGQNGAKTDAEGKP